MKKYIILSITNLFLINCQKQQKDPSDKLQVVTTTTMLTDLVKNIGGDVVSIEGLMGSGVDPHLYKASEGDATKLFNADIVFYNGLHLEGKLEDVFKKMKHQNIITIPVSDTLNKKELIASETFASNYDPHIWFNIKYWRQVAHCVTNQLKRKDPKNTQIFEENKKKYLKKLEKLEKLIQLKIEELPQEQRILVTAHDAFNYFGKAYKFNVVGLQGLSTATEAGVRDVQELCEFIIKNKVKAIFVESSVPERTVEALQKAVQSKGHEVKIGGTLYSDALGSTGTEEGTYLGMYQYNVETIVEALK